jgi:putative transposase
MEYRRSILPGGTFFFTLVTQQRFPYFQDEIAITLLEEAIRYVQERHPFIMIAFVYLPDHIHMRWELPEDDSDYPTRLRLIKSYVSRKFPNRPIVTNQSRQSKGEQEIWQRRYWEHTCRNQQDLNNHIDYIHNNPVKHGYVNAPSLWNHSSFHDYVTDGIYSLDWPADIQSTINFQTDWE